MTSRRAFDSFTEIATLRIELRDSDPLIWRVVEAPTSITLKVLHDIVQVTMGWFDCHLWEIRVGDHVYGPPVGKGMAPRRNALHSRLRDVIGPGETRISYIYDFGDSWEHDLIVSDVRPGDPAIAYPRLIAGERDSPPENCGGIPGFYAMLEARDDPGHPGHADIAEWLDGYDPEAWDTFPVEGALHRIAARRNAAAKRIVPPQH